MTLVDGAIEALVRGKTLRRARAHSDPDVGRDDRRGTPALRGSVTHPLARTRNVIGQHPVQENAIGYRAAEPAQARSHRGHHDASRLGQQRPKLGHRPP
jgi:hypothetical protein